ncbi:MAG: endonuclease Q family protein [Patescibacteria group bacterium]
MILPEMAEWAVKKGIDILSTGDWTHPLWLREIRSQLEEKGEGLYGLRIKDEGLRINDVRFLLSTEIASIYKQGEKLRRIHNLVFAPNFETAEKITKELVRRGCNLHSDGRPIIGISSKNLLEILLSIDKSILLIPCHVWTPHFGIYGSASGFDSLDEAFEELSPYVYGIETGLSSDPEMNWQMKELVNRSILSFSDAHSPPKMGRETTVFELEEPSYESIKKAIMRLSNNIVIASEALNQTVQGDAKQAHSNGIAASPSAPRNDNKKTDNRILYTIEFYPEEGKYHFSGHRNCRVVRGPEETRKDGAICPVCKRQLTEGVLYRVGQLGNKDSSSVVEEKISPNRIKWFVDKTKKHPPFIKLVPLLEILAEGMESTVTSPKVKEMFDSLCSNLDSEINILLKIPIFEIQKIAGKRIAEGIDKVRKGEIDVDPGFDGEYGKVRIWRDNEIATEPKEGSAKTQLGLGF